MSPPPQSIPDPLTLRLLSLVLTVLFFLLPPPPLLALETPDPSRFEREILVPNARDAVQLEVLANGDVLFAEFHGALKLWESSTRSVRLLGQLAVHAKGEVGLLGMAVERGLGSGGSVYVLYCPKDAPHTMQVSRLRVREGRLLGESEEVLLSWPYDTEHVFHMGGALWMDAKGDLYVGTGDNCHWNPGLPVDMRPGRRSWDAQRSAANSRDLRGKVLRIHPLPEGGYAIPEGNLFPDGRDGFAEIYGMGLRNPFRVSVDDATGRVFIADVGPNVLPELGVQPAGYEEINATDRAANFGWPYFVGPNEALPLFDFELQKPVRVQKPEAPVNESPNNTGIRALPPARGALLWYSSLPSMQFPTVGSGGRSIMTGPVYRFSAANPSPVKFPEYYDGHLFVFEWMRNWIQSGKAQVAPFVPEPFLPAWNFRRPIDLKFGPDGALYLIEYGDQWWGNSDSRLVRVGYRRGNRPPVVRLVASETAGLQPVALEFDASASSDPDGDALQYVWSVDGREVGRTSRLRHVFDAAGSHEVRVKVLDTRGAQTLAKETVSIGNARPVVRFERPAHGSFFDWSERIDYAVGVEDRDGESVQLERVLLHGEFRGRRSTPDGAAESVEPGLARMRASTCFACHQLEVPSAGPAYRAVAQRYRGDVSALDRLSQKVVSGGAGVWGAIPMPPHPQHELAEVRQMVAWVLSLGDAEARSSTGARGQVMAPKKPSQGDRVSEGVLLLTASYTDEGRSGTQPRLEGRRSIVLHSRRKKAALYDSNSGMAYVEQVEGERGILGHFKDGASIVWRELNLEGIEHLLVRAGAFGARAGFLELRRDSPTGALLVTVEVPSTGESEFRSLPVQLPKGLGLCDVCVVARLPEPGAVLGLNWIEFNP